MDWVEGGKGDFEPHSSDLIVEKRGGWQVGKAGYEMK